LRIIQGDIDSASYDIGQRAFELEYAQAAAKGDLILDFLASEDSPLVNACLVLKDWGEEEITLQSKGQRLRLGENYQVSYRKTLTGTDLLIWLQKTTFVPFKITITRMTSAPKSMR
jgi:hypothetical protein